MIINFIIPIVYIFLLLIHGYLFLTNHKSRLVTVVSFILLFLLMSGHKFVGNGDAGDFYTYWNNYTNFELSEQRDFSFYYLFYCSEILGLKLSLSFYQWWAVMTILSLLVLARAIRNFKLSYHLFCFFFMVYYVFIFYGGLKFYYGMCLFLNGTYFLMRGNKRDKFRFFILTCLAGGMHVMYYLYLPFIFIDTIKTSNIKRIVGISLFFSIVVLLLGRRGFLTSVQFIFSLYENDTIGSYLQSRTNGGFFLAVGMQLLSLYYAYTNYRLNCLNRSSEAAINFAKKLYLANLMCIFYYPLFMFALTFMRLITAFSLITITLSGVGTRYLTFHKRLRLFACGMLIVFGFYYINVYLNGYFDKTIKPFFNSYYFGALASIF